MLVLSRKTRQEIMIGPDVVVTVVSVKGNRVKIGIEAPDNVNVVRKELLPDGPTTWGAPDFDANSAGPDSLTMPEIACLTR
jgi:carbon storage regulator CsrA